MAPRSKSKAADAAPVEAASETAPDVEYFHFQIRPELTVDDESDETPAVRRIGLGGTPRIAIQAGEVFATPDPRTAARLRRVPQLEEVRS